MGRKVTLCRTDQLKPGQGAQVEVEGRMIAVFNVDGQYYAIGGECTHQGGPLGEGELDDTRVTCPWHGSQFDVASGEVLGPPAMENVPSYPVVVEDDEVKVELA